MDFARRTRTLATRAPPVQYFYPDPLALKFFTLYNVHGNDSRDDNKSFSIEVELWVYGKKVNAMALIDTGASISVIDKKLVHEEKLVT